MSEENDDASKTEEPSYKKLEDARKKGQSIYTRELSHFFMLLAAIFFLKQMSGAFSNEAMGFLSPFITRPESFTMDAASVSDILREVMISMLSLLALPFLLTFVAALCGPILQGKWVFAPEQIKPKWEKVNPLAGLKRIYGKKSIVEFLKNVLKISVVAIICVMLATPYIHNLPSLISIDATYSLEFSARIATKLMVGIVILLFLLSIGDYLYQRFIFMKSMMMTKQEVKDEYKQQEGDPHQKQKLKQLRADRARRRMMANVPKADVIITNPTHYAVALKYDEKTMAVPKVIAKGSDEVALRIREMAQEHRITIVRNPPLARALYDTTDIDDEIPIAQYQAVAKIIGYVYKLKGKRPAQPLNTKPAPNKGSGPRK